MPAPSPPGIEETSSEGATEEGVSLPRPPQPSAQGYLRVRAVRRVFISRGGCVVGGLWAEPAEPAKPWALEDRGAVLWSVGWRLTPPHCDGGETGEEGTPQEPRFPALHHHVGRKRSLHLCVLLHVSKLFSLDGILWRFFICLIRGLLLVLLDWYGGTLGNTSSSGNQWHLELEKREVTSL